MRDLIIAGDGVHALEMAEIVERMNAAQPAWNLLGFVSRDSTREGETRNGYPVIGGASVFELYLDAAVAFDFEWPRPNAFARERCATLIDPTVFRSRTAEIGAGCVIYPHGYIGANVRIGDFAFILSGCAVNHDNVLEDYVTLTTGVKLAGNVYVEERAYLGQASTVRQFVRIGKGSMIGMGAVVVKDVRAGTTIVGNPGKELAKA